MRGASFLQVSVIITLGVAGLVASPLGCGGSKNGSGFDDGGTGDNDGGGGGSGGQLGGGSGSGSNQDGCSDQSKLVYVVDSSNGLHSFNPGTLAFATIGTLNCHPSGGSKTTPNSMAVDRAGTAWVNFTDGELFKVSTTDASCTPTSFNPSQNPSNGNRWGMAFSSNSSGSTDETLFVDPGDGSGSGNGIYTYDTVGNTLTEVGDFTDGLAGAECELTGTGDARLYAFLTTTPAVVAQVNKSSGATPSASQAPLEGVSTGMAWAFSFWGGDFWLYTSSDGVTSSVTQYKTSSDNSINVVVDDTGFAIVGAGVSTCAPTTPPR